jgi:rhamnosyltransferase
LKDLISITIMVRDSGPILDEFLKRLRGQKSKLPYELVVLYYGHGSETLKRLKPFSSKIIQISPEDFIIGKSRDLVCKNTSGKYIVTVSVDALPTNKLWLNELIEPIVTGRADIVQGGQLCPKHKDHNYPDFFYWERDYIFFYSSEGKRFINQYGNIGLSCVNMAFRKEVWEKGGFGNVSYCEDKFFQKHAYKAGYVSIFNKRASTLHAHSYPTVKSLFKRISNEGLGWKQVGEKYEIVLFLKDIFRVDLHLLALKTLLKNELKYRSEILFFFIRPIALYWGNNFAKNIY